MRIYPAIDIKDGKCVRLVQGKFDDVTVYSASPADVAKQWQAAGAEFLHIVDLDGARSGRVQGFHTVAEICAAITVPMQLGGGVRDEEAIKRYIDCGVNRVIIGTKAVSDKAFLRDMAKKYGDKLVLGIDAKDGFAATDGWERVSRIRSVDLALEAADMGIKNIIYTDIATDGMLSGPNLTAMSEMVRSVPVNVIASGGVSSLDDLIALADRGVEGAIVGKALYTGRVDLAAAIRYFKEGKNAEV